MQNLKLQKIMLTELVTVEKTSHQVHACCDFACGCDDR